MKKQFPILIICLLAGGIAHAQNVAGIRNKRLDSLSRGPVVKFPVRGLQVDGDHLTDSRFQAFVMHGVNFDPIGKGIPSQNVALLDEVAKSGANAVRLAWNPAYNSSVYSIANLELYIQKCIALRIVPIVEYHGVTSGDLPAVFQRDAMGFWLDNSTKAMLQKYQTSLIINIANEWGKVDWSTGDAAALATYANTYRQAIASLRAAGYSCPLMIDAPDGGAGEQRLASVCGQLFAADAQANIIFSVHPYWWKYNGQPGTASSAIDAIKATGHCFVLGEVANIQDSGPTDCTYNIDDTSHGSIMEAVLMAAKKNGIGWLAWEWSSDGCKMRELTTDGTFANLTGQGAKIINDPRFGLSKIPNAKANIR